MNHTLNDVDPAATGMKCSIREIILAMVIGYPLQFLRPEKGEVGNASSEALVEAGNGLAL